MATLKDKYRTPEGILTHPAFLDLPTKQQEWFRELVANGGDKVKATHKVYPSTLREHSHHNYTDERIAKLMKNAAIRILVSLYFADAAPHVIMSKQELALHLSMQLRNPDLDPQLFAKFTQYLMLLEGWHLPEKQMFLRDFGGGMRTARKTLEAKVEDAISEPEPEKPEQGIDVNELVLRIEQQLKGGK